MKTRKLVLVVLLVSISLSLSALASPSSHAMSLAPSSPILSNCYKQIITLHGAKSATAKCLVSGKVVNGRMVPINSAGRPVPDTYYQGCSAVDALIGIRSYDNGYVCFGGHGYLAVHLTNVYELDSYTIINAIASGWVRYYNNKGGYFFYYNPFARYDCSNSPICNVLITQVDIY